MIEMKTDRKSVEEFWNQLQKDCDIEDWKLEWWFCDGEALCNSDTKTIILGDCNTTESTKYLLIHEVAHILVGTEKMHNPGWWSMFMKLLKKYNFKKHPKDNYEDYYNPEYFNPEEK